MSRRNPFVLLMKWAEHYAYTKADRVVSLLPYAERHMLEHGLAEHKFAYIPNGFDSSRITANAGSLPHLHDSVIGELREKKTLIVGYAGGHAISNALGSFIISAAYLRGSHAALVLVGSGAEKEKLMALARKLGLENVYFLPPVPLMSVQPLLATMDVLFIGWQNKPIYQFGVGANKLIDYMLSGKPIIHAIGSGNDVVAECGCGISVPPENSRAIAEAVAQLMAMTKDAREEMGKRGREYVLKNNRTNDLAEKFIEVCAERRAAV
jgi:glycosyltransferase involved in cell wall biosynthesis